MSHKVIVILTSVSWNDHLTFYAQQLKSDIIFKFRET